MYSSPSRRLAGATPLVVSGGFMPPSIIAVILGFPGLAEQIGGVGRLAIGPRAWWRPLVLAPLGALRVALMRTDRETHALLAMQKAVGSNPLSRSQEALQLAGFLR
jgi:hypothetical protein